MPQVYEFSRSALKRIAAAADAADIEELCYLVFGRGRRVKRVIKVPNRAVDPVMHHVIGMEDYRRVRARSSLRHLKCLGFLHTHPASRAVPGPGDIAGYRAGALLFIYADVYEELRAFRLGRNGSSFDEKEVRLC